MDDEDDLASMRNEVLNTIGDNALALAMPPAGEAPPPPPDDGWAPADLGLGQGPPGLTDGLGQTGVQVAQGLANQATNPLDVIDPGANDGLIGLNAVERAAARALMKATGADKGFDRTISAITGGQFSPAERQTLEDLALKAADMSDRPKLMGIQEGPPVYLTPDQKAVIDRIVGQLGTDPLAQRGQTAYQKALNAGQVRIR